MIIKTFLISLFVFSFVFEGDAKKKAKSFK